MAKAKKQKDVRFTWKEFKKQKFLMIVAFFAFAYGIVFCYAPLVGWLMAFQQYKPKTGIFGSKFIGFDKFEFLFGDERFLQVIRNTFVMGALNLVTTTFFAVLFAILLNEIRGVKTKKVVQTVSYLPHFLSWIVVTGILHDALSSSGVVNDILKTLKITDSSINFFAETKYFWGIVAFANVWKETGWNAIIYLAAITAIDPCLYEAAAIDGAGRIQKIKHITLPGIKSTFVVLLIMNVGWVLNAGFEVQYILGNDLIRSVSQTIDIYVLKWGISQNDFSLGTAAGLFKSVVSIVLILIANAVSKRVADESIF